MCSSASSHGKRYTRQPAPSASEKVPMAESPKQASNRRCAIYTRKSSEEGLEQEFNSLQAQRETRRQR
jgi:hypothetical protein